MNSFNILHFAPSYHNQGGGVYEVVENLSEAQCAGGKSTVDILALETFVGRHQENKNIHNLLPSKFSQFKLMSEVLIFLFRRVKSYDVIHVHGAWSVQFLLIIPFLYMNREKIVYQPHGLFSPEAIKKSRYVKKMAWVFYQQFFIRFSKIIVCCSERERADLSHYWRARGKLTIIPNGIDNSFFDERPNLAPRQMKFLYFSQIIPIKNLESLFYAISILNESESSHIYLDIYGYGLDRYIDELKRLAFTLSITDNIAFKGGIAREERVPIYDSYEYFILPSLSENFGIAVLEALSRGCKVLVSKRTPWQDYKHPGLTLFEPDRDSICIALKSVLSCANVTPVISPKSDFDLDRFRWENISLEFHSAYFDKKNKIR
jgi:glycosyltransferase involved in cell wall biosynthesis